MDQLLPESNHFRNKASNIEPLDLTRRALRGEPINQRLLPFTTVTMKVISMLGGSSLTHQYNTIENQLSFVEKEETNVIPIYIRT